MSDQVIIGLNQQTTVPQIAHKRDSEPGKVQAEYGFPRLVENAPISENGTVTGARPPRRATNKQRRDREHLTPQEVELLYEAAKKHGRHSQRDGLMIWMAYRHGLRVAELVALRWTAPVDFDA